MFLFTYELKETEAISLISKAAEPDNPGNSPPVQTLIWIRVFEQMVCPVGKLQHHSKMQWVRTTLFWLQTFLKKCLPPRHTFSQLDSQRRLFFLLCPDDLVDFCPMRWEKLTLLQVLSMCFVDVSSNCGGLGHVPVCAMGQEMLQKCVTHSRFTTPVGCVSPQC